MAVVVVVGVVVVVVVVYTFIVMPRLHLTELLLVLLSVELDPVLRLPQGDLQLRDPAHHARARTAQGCSA